jgi:hypothetical protein
MEPKFQKGDIVEYYQEPIAGDWEQVGIAPIEIPKNKPLEVTEVWHIPPFPIRFSNSIYWYPVQMFRKFGDTTEPEIYFDDIF